MEQKKARGYFKTNDFSHHICFETCECISNFIDTVMAQFVSFLSDILKQI